MRRAGDEASAAHAGSHRVSGVDADVTALDERGVVLVAEQPAELLGQPGRNCDRDRAAWPEHSCELGHRVGVVGDVFHHFGSDDAIETRGR